MKLSDKPSKVADEVISEVRAIKRGISERHGNDIDRLTASLMAQENVSKPSEVAKKTDAK